MSTRLARLTALATWALLLWLSPWGIGQEGPVSGTPGGLDEAPREAASVSRDVSEARPVLYYLRDEMGRLVPVPGFSMQEFEELYQLREELARPDQQPRFVLQSLSVSGTVDNAHVELAVRVDVLAREDGWIRVPMGFGRSFLLEPGEYKGAGEGVVQYEEDAEEYVGWIRGAAGDQHQFALKILAPLAEVGDETRLRFFAPRATVSQLSLTVAVGDASAAVTQGAGLLTVLGGDQEDTEFSVLGLGGDFELSWHGPIRRAPKQQAALEVEGTILARIDAPGVETEAVLRVHGSGAPIDSFRLRLPPGTTLVTANPAGVTGYSVFPVDVGVDAPSDRELVEVRLDEKTAEPVEIRLATRRLQDLSQPAEWLELAGFEVVGAARQWGHIDVAAGSDWQVLWGSSAGVRQVEPLPVDGVVAGFDYDAQPYSLNARLVPKRTRISVEPEYRLLVDADRIRLEASLIYTIRGARAFNLDVAMPPGWESVEVEPETLVAVDGIAVDEDNVLSIPLLKPSTGKMGVRLSAQWPIPPGTGVVELPLPQPQADWPGLAAVAVSAADNIELIPDHDQMINLIRQPVGPATEVPENYQPPVFYRAEAAEAVFSAGLRVHSQQILAEVASRIDLDHRGGNVHQTLSYTVDYEPADSFTVRAPRALFESGELEFWFEGQSLAPAVRPGDEMPRDAAMPVRLQLDLPRACIGACELKISYPLRFADLASGIAQLSDRDPVLVAIPLVSPDEGLLPSNRLEIDSPPDIDVRLPDVSQSSWKVEPRAVGASGGLRLSTDLPADQVVVELELDEREGTTLVQRAWVQTWLMSASRQDRAVFFFTSSRRELALILPAGTAPDRVQAILDGQEVDVRVDDQRRATISLGSAMPGGRHLLDVRCASADGHRSPGRVSIDLPRIEGDTQGGRLYWQLVVPRNEHLVATPAGLTNEFTWTWDGYSWGRKPLLTPADLAAWVGLKPSADDVLESAEVHGANCYLFSSIGAAPEWRVWTAWRSSIVLGVSSLVLVGGLLLIYVPRTRHPAALLLFAVGLLAAGALYYPEPTLLLAQAASLGLFLVLLAGFLEHSVAGRHRLVAPLESLSVVLESASTQTHYPVPPAAAQMSTQAAPIAIESSPLDSDA